eukprot:3847838-Rhodomonas_salina.1
MPDSRRRPRSEPASEAIAEGDACAPAWTCYGPCIGRVSYHTQHVSVLQGWTLRTGHAVAST